MKIAWGTALPVASLATALALTLPRKPLRAEEEVVSDLPPLVTEKTHRAIEQGVAWLAKVQGRDGGYTSGHGGWASYPVAMSALAGMAFLGHGDTLTRGKYAPNVRRIVGYILRQSRRAGLITAPGEESRSMYGHGFATMFLAECLGAEGEPDLEAEIKEALRRAIDVTARAQSRAGGWLYTPDSGGDEGSVTVTQVQALRACRNAGVTVPHATVKNAVKYIERSVCPDGGIAYSAGGGDSRPAITAAAVAVLYNAGEYDSPIAKKAIDYCRRRINPTTGAGAEGHYFYTHLYLAQAYWQLGGKDWNGYYPKIRDTLLSRQAGDGSWDGDGVGKVYGTAIACTILALPYEHAPVYAR
jgi:hypothetical protein